LGHYGSFWLIPCFSTTALCLNNTTNPS